MMTENEIDILEIDEKIKNEFLEREKKLPEMKNHLIELEKTLNNINTNNRLYNEIQKNILDIQEKISKIEDKIDLNFYIIETAELINNYKIILSTPVKISFVRTKICATDNIKKTEIINKYIEVAQKYIDIPLKRDKKDSKPRKECEQCGNKKDFILDDNIFICSDCGNQLDIMQYTTSYKDVDRVNISAKYTYDRKVHFRDCINQYQGKQNCTIESKVYEQLEQIFEKHHLLIGDKNTRKEIRFSKITKEHVLMFLKELGFSKHYENVILIHYTMTGKKPDDISHIEDKLLADFDLLVETYDKLFKNKVSRVNFISTQYVLYQLLLKHKHPCRKEDFVILKTMDRKSFHDNIASELFATLNWSFTPLY
jgi:hypothetical protein